MNLLSKQRASMKTNEVNLDNEKNNILINIRKTHRNLRNLIAQIEIAEQNVKKVYEHLDNFWSGEHDCHQPSVFYKKVQNSTWT